MAEISEDRLRKIFREETKNFVTKKDIASIKADIAELPTKEYVTTAVTNGMQHVLDAMHLLHAETLDRFEGHKGRLAAQGKRIAQLEQRV